MNAYLQRLRPLAFLPALLLLLTVVVAEQDRTELSEMALVIGLGLDSNPKGGEPWELTVELAYKQQNDSPGEKQVFTAAGGSWEELREELGKVLDKNAHWSSASLLILGGPVLETAEGKELLRSIFLDPKINGELLLAVSAEEPSQVFSASFGESNYLSAGLEQGLRLQAKTQEKQAVSLFDYMEQVLALEGSLAVPIIHLEKQEDQAEAAIAKESYLAF